MTFECHDEFSVLSKHFKKIFLEKIDVCEKNKMKILKMSIPEGTWKN